VIIAERLMGSFVTLNDGRCGDIAAIFLAGTELRAVVVCDEGEVATVDIGDLTVEVQGKGSPGSPGGKVRAGDSVPSHWLGCSVRWPPGAERWWHIRKNGWFSMQRAECLHCSPTCRPIAVTKGKIRSQKFMASTADAAIYVNASPEFTGSGHITRSEGRSWCRITLASLLAAGLKL
jgi:hypothetical protein